MCTDLAVTQQALGDRRGGVRRALRSNRNAEAILRELIKVGHELDGSLGLILDNLAAVLAKLGHEPEAVGAITEAVIRCRRPVPSSGAVVRCRTAYRRQPELFQAGFWSALRHNAHLLGPAAIKESVALLAEACDVAMAVNDDAVRRDMLAEIRTTCPSIRPRPPAGHGRSSPTTPTRSHNRTARRGQRVATTGLEFGQPARRPGVGSRTSLRMVGVGAAVHPPRVHCRFSISQVPLGRRPLRMGSRNSEAAAYPAARSTRILAILASSPKGTPTPAAVEVARRVPGGYGGR